MTVLFYVSYTTDHIQSYFTTKEDGTPILTRALYNPV